MRKKIFILIGLLIFQIPISALELDEVINKTLKTYENMNSLQIHFIQEFCEKTSGSCQVFKGKIYFLKPNYFRMEIDNPKQIYVGDSVSLWIYLPEKKKAIRQHLGEQIPFAVNPDMFLKGYEDRFNAQLEIDDYYKLVLTPKEETEIYKKIIINIHKRKFEITGITIVDETDSENKFVFKNIQLNKKISKKIFKFNPPKGTEVIEQ